MHFDDECDLQGTREYTTKLITMLGRCPSLEELHISPWNTEYLDTTQLLEYGRWPSLKMFTLRYMSDDAYCVFNTFTEAHPALERLYINPDRNGTPNSNQVWTKSLPNLKALHVGSMRDMTKIVSPITLQNLECLSVVDLSLKPRRVSKHLQILAQIPTLRSVTVRFPRPTEELLLRLTKSLPLIQRLHFMYNESQNLNDEECESVS